MADRETRKPDAGREANQIERIRHDGGFVEIVDAPDKTAVGVAPGAEIFQMQVADGKHLRGIHQFRAQFPDLSGPAKISRAQEDEGALFHLVVLIVDVLDDDVALRGQPCLESRIVLAKRHRAPQRYAIQPWPQPALSYLRMCRPGTSPVCRGLLNPLRRLPRRHNAECAAFFQPRRALVAEQRAADLAGIVARADADDLITFRMLARASADGAADSRGVHNDVASGHLERFS